MMAGGFGDAGSGVPRGIAEGLERLRLRRPGAGDGLDAVGQAEEAGLRLELEDIARERYARVFCRRKLKDGLYLYLQLFCFVLFCVFCGCF